MAQGMKFDIPDIGFSDANLENVFNGGSIQDVLNKFGQKLIGDVRQSLDSKGKNATGGLNQSLEFNLKVMGSDFAFVFSMVDYWRYVDKGRKPGKQPPLEEIRKWVRVKAVFGGIGTQDPDSIAFAIARKIGKFGIEPSNFYSDVINDGRLIKLQEALEDAAKEDLKGIIINT